MEELNLLYNDKKLLLKAIINNFRIISNSQDLKLNNVENISALVDKINVLKNTPKLTHRLELIPVFVDYCFMYYLKHYDITVPVIKFPSNKIKLNIIFSVAKCKDQKINNLFNFISDDKYFKEFMKENPPFYLTSETSFDQIEITLNTYLVPRFKELLDYIIRL